MACTLTAIGGSHLRNVNAAANNIIVAKAQLVFTGNYVAGGDALDLTPLTRDLPVNEIIDIQAESNSPLNTAFGQIGGSYVIQGQPGPLGAIVFGQAVTLFNAWKVKLFNVGGNVGVEYGAGPYGAPVLTDYVVVTITFRKYAGS